MKSNTTWQEPSGRIKVQPIQRAINSMIQDPAHEAFFLFGSSSREYVLPRNLSGHLHNPFTCKEEQAWLESLLDTDLNYHKKDDNEWAKTKVSLGKDAIILDLSNPRDYISYLVLLANKRHIAPNGASQDKKLTYRYVMLAEDFEVKQKAKVINSTKDAYKFLGKLEEDKQSMLDFLTVYGKGVDDQSSEAFLIGAVADIMESDLKGFLAIARDKANYTLRLTIQKATKLGIVILTGREYSLPGGDKLSAKGTVATLENVLLFLQSPENQDILLTLEARVKNAKD